MELNVQDWKEFKLSDYFNVVGTTTTKLDTLIDEYGIGNYPYVTTQATNNGVAGYYNCYTEEGNILVADSAVAGYVSYQPCNFSASDHVEKIMPKSSFNKYIAMFLVTILNLENYRYSYGRKFNQDNIRNTVMKLPAKQTSNGSYIPDWQFMEDYIKSLHHKPITTKVKSGIVKELDVDNWEEFKVQDLFELVHGKANDGMLEEGNDCVYLGAKLNDCGFMRKCKYNEKLAHEGNCICFVTNGEGSVGYAFYKGLEDKFIATIDLVMGYADFLTPAIGSFIATCLCLERRKYSHGRKWKKTLHTTVIKLPIQRDSNGNPVIDDNRTYSDNGYVPDWQYMEDYINSLPYSDRI